MCGIVGANLADGEAVRKVSDGLERLEYRGYDSAGLASVGNPSLKVEKETGTVEQVERPEESELCVGHTRWATHGGVTPENAHPHTGCSSEVAVVHNGIIENHGELRERLEGHSFSSDTDTEVIPHLIEQEMEKGRGLTEASRNVMEMLEGSYAVVAVTAEGEMAAFRKDSPLVIGDSDQGYIVSSDVTAFLEETDRACFLENGQLAEIEEDELTVYQDGSEIEPEFRKVEWDAEQADKKGYRHFMEKEIREQSETIERAASQGTEELEKAAEMVEECENVYLTGCGTAFHAAVIGSRYLREAGIDARVEKSHELEYRADGIGEDDLVVAVSQSGETADLLSMLKESDGDTLAVVNVEGSTLDRSSEESLYVNAGPEIGVASTKAFTAQLAVLKLLAAELEGRAEEVKNSLAETAGKVEEVLERNDRVLDRLSSEIAEDDSVFFIGRGKGRVLANESALKLKELSYIHAEGFAGGEFKHGTLALVEDGVKVFSFSGHRSEEIQSNAVEARARGADVVEVGGDGSEFHAGIEVPEDPNCELLEIVPMQELAYRTAVERGNNPDRPRNLAKSVTVK